MKKEEVKKIEVKLEQERSHFHLMLAKNPNYFGNIPGSKLKSNYKLVANASYEELNCVGYNPDTEDMEAIFSIKKTTGYSGNLCATGSFEYVRFYLDFHDGAGFIDQGSVAINVHDIPTAKDCSGNSIFPIKYAASLKKKTSKHSSCETPVLPTLRAILSWSIDSPADSPDWQPVWGSVMNCDVQLKPSWVIKFPDIDFSKYLELAVSSPNLSTKQLMEITKIDLSQLQSQPKLQLADFAKRAEKLKIPASRFAYKTVYNMIKYPTSQITMMDKVSLNEAKVNWSDLIDKLGASLLTDKSKANVDYEELECIGLDYNTESIVATIKIKKNNGYSGNLCDAGSKEYISFWIDWDDQCSWQYLSTVELKVHDIKMTGDELCYSVAIPLDATYHRKLCTTPNVIRLRSVLSWNVPPSTTDPNKLEFYGNRVDAHVQIKPGVVINPGDLFPIFNIIGGIDVDHVEDATGLTKSGSFFAYNGTGVPTGAAFGGVVVLNGPTFPGHRYRIKVTNLTTSASYYVTDSFTVVGFLPHAPWVQYTNQSPDAIDHWYNFLDPAKNTLNVLARFAPGTEDQLRVEMEVESAFGVFSKTIQMDNTAPVIQLKVDDEGDCTHYAKGDTITGHYYVYDKNISSWSFGTTWGGAANGTANTPPLPGNSFSIVTPADAYPCGGVSLYAIDKTIVDSQGVGHPVWASYNICLKDK
jgi:hypothetical protein